MYMHKECVRKERNGISTGTDAAVRNEKIRLLILSQKKKEPYEFKRRYAGSVQRNSPVECDGRELNYHVSVGGLDSIVLYLFLHEICGIDAPGVSASSLEDKSIQRVHKALGIINVPPLKRKDGSFWTKAKVIQEFGFPVISKEVAAKIELLQNPSEKNKTVRHAIITGETGAYGGWQKKFKDAIETALVRAVWRL